MQQITGSCLCGALKYTGNTEILFTVACHCRACQKSTGTAFSVVVGVKRPDVTITGDTLKTYEDVGDSGQPTYRHFCARCGTTIMAELAIRPDLACIKAGTLDHREELHPQSHVYWRDHQEWIRTLDTLPKHDTIPKQ
jgi:hypothetical protein